MQEITVYKNKKNLLANLNHHSLNNNRIRFMLKKKNKVEIKCQ